MRHIDLDLAVSPSHPSREPAVELKPKRQPGRADRKAAAYAEEIVRLRAANYTYEAIREAMAEVGIALSTSALRREVRRRRRPSQVVLSDSQSVPRPTAANALSTPPPGPPLPTPSTAVPARPRGHDIAEAFFNANPSNPLVHPKEIP